jgi:hypothetical protein
MPLSVFLHQLRQLSNKPIPPQSAQGTLAAMFGLAPIATPERLFIIARTLSGYP